MWLEKDFNSFSTKFLCWILNSKIKENEKKINSSNGGYQGLGKKHKGFKKMWKILREDIKSGDGKAKWRESDVGTGGIESEKRGELTRVGGGRKKSRELKESGRWNRGKQMNQKARRHQSNGTESSILRSLVYYNKPTYAILFRAVVVGEIFHQRKTRGKAKGKISKPNQKKTACDIGARQTEGENKGKTST